MTSTEQDCDKAIATVYGKDSVVKLGRKDRRTPNTQGVPDRLYFCGGRMVWFEVKSANDYLSPAQITFLTRVLAAKGIAGCGNRNDLLELLSAPNPLMIGTRQIATYSSQVERYARKKARDSVLT